MTDASCAPGRTVIIDPGLLSLLAYRFHDAGIASGKAAAKHYLEIADEDQVKQAKAVAMIYRVDAFREAYAGAACTRSGPDICLDLALLAALNSTMVVVRRDFLWRVVSCNCLEDVQGVQTSARLMLDACRSDDFTRISYEMRDAYVAVHDAAMLEGKSKSWEWKAKGIAAVLEFLPENSFRKAS